MIKINIQEVLANLQTLPVKQKAALALFGETMGEKMANDAKNNAPWQDRTANARQSISSYCRWEKDILVIGVTGGVDYFPFLELAHEKKYAILYPTILKHKEEVEKGVKIITKP